MVPLAHGTKLLLFHFFPFYHNLSGNISSMMRFLFPPIYLSLSLSEENFKIVIYQLSKYKS